MFWGGSRSTKPCVFPCKVAAGDDERYLVCATGAAGVGLSFFLPQCNGGLKLLWVCLCVHSYRVFWNLRLQSALEWLHDCCHLVLLCVLIRAGLRRDAAKRMVMAASRLLGAAAACVILVSFAGEDCKSYWSGGIQAAIVICQQIGASNFPFQNSFYRVLQNRLFSRFGVEIRFWSCNFRHRCAQFYCVLQLSLCRSHCSGCVKVARCRRCMRNTSVFCS